MYFLVENSPQMKIVYKRQHIVSLLIFLFSICLVNPTKAQSQSKKDSLFFAWENESLSDSLRLQAIKTYIKEDVLYSNPDRAFQLCKLQIKFAEKTGNATSVSNAINTQGICKYLKGDIPTAITYLNKSLKMDRKLEHFEGIANSLNSLGVMTYIQGDLEQAFDYNTESLKYMKKIGDPKGIAKSLNNRAILYKYLGDFKKYIETLEQTREIYEEIIPGQRSLAILYNNIGKAYSDLGNYSKALNFILKSMVIHENLGNKKGMAVTYNNMGYLHEIQGNFEKAAKYMNKSLKLSKEMGDQRGISLAHKTLGLNALSIDNNASALDHFSQSLKIGKKIGDKAIVSPVLRYIGKVHLSNKNYQEAINFLTKSLDEATTKQLKNEIASTQVVLAEVYFELGQFTEALEHGEKAFDLTNEIISVETTRDVSNILYEIYKSQHRYREALQMNETYYKTRDSINNQENKQLLMQREFEYEYEKKEALANQERAAQEKIVREQRRRKNFKVNTYIGATALIILFIVVFYANKKISKQRSEARKVKELEKLKTQFYTNITHEFRTPLTLIVNPLEKLLHKKNYTDREKKQIQTVQNQAGHMMQLVNQMLDLSKMDNDMLRLEKSWGNPSLLVKKIVDAFTALSDEKEVTLQQRLHSETDFAYFDPRLLETIVYNLISNALKFTPKKGTITVALELKTEQSEEMVLSVSDTGSGMTKQQQQQIFKRFYSDNQNKASVGTGIGLSLVKEFVDISGGIISVKSEPAAGSTFTIVLPVEVSSKEALEAISLETKADTKKISVNTSPKTPSKKQDQPLVLIVDDHPEIRRIILKSLDKTYKVIQASDGVEGLQAAADQIPDIIISDVMMPRMDGIEFIHKLKNNPATNHIPIILLSSKSERIDREIGFKSGAVSYLTKPFYETELIALLNSILQLREKSWEAYKKKNQIPQHTLADEKDEVVEKLIQYIKANISNSKLDVDDLCQHVGMSRTGLYRKLKAVTNYSATVFVRKVRLDVAAELLKQPGARISEVAFNCGFNTHSHFSQCFAKEFGMSPKAYMASL